jgi:hypothetical protein
MSKPIFIIRYPIEAYEQLGRGKLLEMQQALDKQLHDYHVLHLVESRAENATVEFEMYNCAEVDDIKFAELKKLIETTIDQYNDETSTTDSPT